MYQFECLLSPLLIINFGKEITKYCGKKNNNSDAFSMTGRSREDYKLI